MEGRESITIVCWLWNGWRPGEYSYQHVNRLYAQLKQWMTGPWRLICITDQPAKIECETVPLWKMPAPLMPAGKFPDCYCRLKLFDRETGGQFGKLLLSIDLDVTVLADLRPLISPAPFKIAVNEHRRATRYCGTFWQLRPGAHPEVWTDYDASRTPQMIIEAGMRGSDQSWFTLKIPNAPTWNGGDGVYWIKRFPDFAGIPKNARLVYFAGNVNPWSEKCREKWPNFYTPL